MKRDPMIVKEGHDGFQKKKNRDRNKLKVEIHKKG